MPLLGADVRVRALLSLSWSFHFPPFVQPTQHNVVHAQPSRTHGGGLGRLKQGNLQIYRALRQIRNLY